MLEVLSICTLYNGYVESAVADPIVSSVDTLERYLVVFARCIYSDTDSALESRFSDAAKLMRDSGCPQKVQEDASSRYMSICDRSEVAMLRSSPGSPNS